MANNWSLLNRYAGNINLDDLDTSRESQSALESIMGAQPSAVAAPPVGETPANPSLTPPPTPPLDIEEAPLDFEPEFDFQQQQFPEITQPPYKPLRLPTQEDIDRAEKSSRDANLLVSLNQAFSMIPASITGKQLPESLVASQRAMADKPLDRLDKAPQQAMKGMEANLETQMNDPRSDISNLTRDYAVALLAKMQGAKEPQQIEDIRNKIANMSATQFERLGIKPLSHMLGKQPGAQQTPYTNGETGNPAVIIGGVWLDGLTGEPIKSGMLQSRTVTIVDDPETGNKLGVGTSGNVQRVFGSEVVPKSPEELERTFKGPNKIQRAELDKEKKHFEKVTANALKKLEAARTLIELLKANTKLEIGAVRTQMPRLSGDVGALTDAEQKIWEGSRAWEDRIKQYVSTITTGTLTDANKKEILKAVNAFKEASEQAILRNKEEVMNRLQLANIPKSHSTQVLPTLGVKPRVMIENLQEKRKYYTTPENAKKLIDAMPEKYKLVE